MDHEHEDHADGDEQADAAETPGPKHPPETWSIEEPFDSSEFLKRRGPWDSYVPIAEQKKFGIGPNRGDP